MTPLDTARRYLDVWNAHDSEAIVETFAPHGTYQDPSVGVLAREAIGAYARGLWRRSRICRSRS